MAISEGGIEQVEKTGTDPIDIERIWRGPVASLEIRVDDVDAAIDRVIGCGHAVDHSLTTPGSVRNVQVGNALLGAAMLVYSVPDGVDYVRAATGRGPEQGDYEAYDPVMGTPDAETGR